MSARPLFPLAPDGVALLYEMRGRLGRLPVSAPAPKDIVDDAQLAAAIS
jgi:hypothetical protein